MILTTTLVVLIFSLILISFYFFYNGNQKTTAYMGLTGFFLLMIIGIMLLSSPLQYVSGNSKNTTYNYVNSSDNHSDINMTTSVLVDNYKTFDSTLNYLFGITLLLGGFWGMFTCMDNLSELKIKQTYEDD